MRVCLTLAWGVIWATGQSVAQRPAVDHQTETAKQTDAAKLPIEHWVAGLGAEGYLSRLKSEEAILEFGSAAIDPLKQAVNSPDIEISIRAQRLLAILLEQDFQQRRKTFLEAPLDASESFGFLQWDAFAKLVGRTDRTKRLFMDIVQNQRDKKSAEGFSGDVTCMGPCLKSDATA